MSKIFIEQIGEYIKSDSDENPIHIFNKFKKILANSTLKNKFCINLLNDKRDIFEAVIVKKDQEEEFVNLNLAYKLFSEKTKKIFLPTSKFFNMIDEKIILPMVEQRYIIKLYEEKLNNMKKELDTDENIHLEIKKLKEIIDHNKKKEHSLEPLNFLEMLKEDNELMLSLFSHIFNINIFICRSWDNDITVVKEIESKNSQHYIILFKYSGKLSATGINSRTFYETGGIKIQDKIITILNYKNHKSIINKLKENSESGVDTFLLDNYNSYLQQIDHSTDIEKLEEAYERQTTKKIRSSENESSENESSENESSENESSENESSENESSENESSENESSENESSSFREETNTSFSEKKEYYDTEIPYFIKNYTDGELVELYKKFINPHLDINKINRRNLEIQYMNYIEKPQENVLNIIQDLKEKML